MGRKPYIKIVYPDASPVAMILTESMVRRASGKRIVETESSERESAGQDLFAGSLCCVTETSVELTLNLAPEAMDFALATLIAKNLTQSERDKAMAASDSLELDALFSPRAGEAAGAGTCIDDVGSAERAADGRATQSGEQEAIEEEDSSTCLTAMLATLIHLAGSSKASKKNRARDIAFTYLNREEIGIPDSAWTTCAAIDKALEEAYEIAGLMNKADRGQVDADELFERLLHEMDPDGYPMEDTASGDEEAATRCEAADGDIDHGLLDDLDEDKSSTAEVGTLCEPTKKTGEVIGHDE